VAAGNKATAADRRGAEMRSLSWRALAAAVLTLPVFVLEMGGHAVPAFHQMIYEHIDRVTNWFVQFLLTTLVLAGPDRSFFTTGIPALLEGRPEMNSLVALGTSAAWGFSVVALFAAELLPESTRAVYFEAAAVIASLILLGR
jgi:Cu+-exporting ATPase